MKFTEYQKSIITRISNKEIKDLKSFQGNFTQEIIEKDYIREVVCFNNDYYYIPSQYSTLSKELIQFIVIWKLLENFNLVFTINKHKIKLDIIYPATNRNCKVEPDSSLIELIYEYCDKDIITIPSIEDFILNGYKTSKELEFEQEKKDRIRAQRITIAVAISTIIITTIFNMIFYSKDRNVLIKNPFTLPDTLKISSVGNYNFIDRQLNKSKVDVNNLKSLNKSKIDTINSSNHNK